jgi:hypothetical protein
LSCGHGSAGFGERIIVDGGEGAEHEAGQVAEDGSAARRNDASSQESVEAPDGIVVPVSVLEVTSVIQKLEGKVIGTVRLRFRVSMAKHGSRVWSPVAAFAAGGRKVEAAMVAGCCGCGLHFLSLS